MEAESNHYSLDLSYQVVTDNDRVFALRFNQALVMASGVESVKIYDVDKATGELLTLDDLFQPGSDYLGVLTENIQEQMRAQMAADSEVYYWVDSEIEDLNFTRLEADTDFYLNDSGELVLVFDEGEVAPHVYGRGGVHHPQRHPFGPRRPRLSGLSPASGVPPPPPPGGGGFFCVIGASEKKKKFFSTSAIKSPPPPLSG